MTEKHGFWWIFETRDMDGWKSVALPFGFCLFNDKRKYTTKYLYPAVWVGESSTGQMSISVCVWTFGIGLIIRSGTG